MSEEQLKTGFNEQLIVGLFTAIVGTLTAWDIYGDSKTGASYAHIFSEGLIVLISFLFLARTIYNLYKKNFKTSKELQATQKESLLLRLDNQKYREESRRLLEGMGVLIDKQFATWNLTHSERDVALLLLKGLSHKEIANIRDTSEKTVRQQAGQVYMKANLEGRAQLSAFFLEDLLLPRKN
ncbi:MAG: helix-turn-helix transcriptional regulator [Bacteriovorax sp.]|nr:helix-turn-helix transcriptional regulator [Bacteriovorax sp.]